MIKQNSLFPVESMTKSDRSLHTPGSFAKKNLLYVQEVGRLQSLKPHRCIREKLDSFLFLIVLEGRGSLDVNGRHYDLQSGNCALIDCMEHYEHISDEADAWRLAWVHFNGNAARGYYDLFYKHNNGNVFSAGAVTLWDDIIGDLLERQKDRDFLAELKCGEQLLHLLNLVIGSISDAVVMSDESERKLAADVREYLNEQYADQRVLENVMTLDGVQETTISVVGEIFIRRYGISMEEYVSNRRLNAAKEMLRFSIKPIEEVAAETGIGDVNVMQKIFTSSEGMSAEEYRRKWAQWIR